MYYNDVGEFANFNEFYNVNKFNRISRLQNEILISPKMLQSHITYYCKSLAFIALQDSEYSEVDTESETAAEETDSQVESDLKWQFFD